MSLTQLHIHHLRNIAFLQCDFHPRLNIFIGPNGSGKTSLLEAIYLLGSGHSFRSRETAPLIQFNQDEFVVFGKTDKDVAISISKSKQSATQAKLDGKFCRSSSGLARVLPCQVFYQDLFDIIDASPMYRRAVMDWGMFHVKPNFLELWKEYKQALKQRNALLKNNPTSKLLKPWDILLDQYAQPIDELRKNYFGALKEKFKEVLRQLTPLNCEIFYYNGWHKNDEKNSLLEILERNYYGDIQRQFTQHGPHQADILIETTAQIKARQYCSRGQQKIILIALKLAQNQLLEQSCLCLGDDLANELDEEHLYHLMQYIKNSREQFFLTSINPKTWNRFASLAAFFELHDGKLQNKPE